MQYCTYLLSCLVMLYRIHTGRYIYISIFRGLVNNAHDVVLYVRRTVQYNNIQYYERVSKSTYCTVWYRPVIKNNIHNKQGGKETTKLQIKYYLDYHHEQPPP